MDDDIKHFVLCLFKGYLNRKKENRLYQENDNVPDIIIRLYYTSINHADFSNIIESFRRKYVYNENILESVHDPKERLGLREMYDYIFSELALNNISVYTILRLHQILYSKVPYPEFGGKFRNQEVYLFGSGMNISTWSNIPADIEKLYLPVNELIIKGKELAINSKAEDLIKFIDDCVDLNCKLIKIHPFIDGNGRTTRMFTNLLFRLANIPPVYIENRERKEYYQAMNCAINEEDYSKIHTFYHYKVCDSIIEHDLSATPNIINNNKTLIK